MKLTVQTRLVKGLHPQPDRYVSMQIGPTIISFGEQYRRSALKERENG